MTIHKKIQAARERERERERERLTTQAIRTNQFILTDSVGFIAVFTLIQKGLCSKITDSDVTLYRVFLCRCRVDHHPVT